MSNADPMVERFRAILKDTTVFPHVPTVVELIKAREEKASQGNWVPASGGTEVPFRTRNGYTLLYCWQWSTGRHAYLNVETDIILSDEDARLAMGW